MIARGFKSVGWVAAVGGAALGCYMVSLNVAAERAELERVELQILTAKREIKALQTELGTRGRFAQLEHWNAEVLALSAPTADQILPNAFKLASYNAPPPTAVERAENVQLAAAEAPQALPKAVIPAVQPAPQPQAAPMLRRASLVSTPKPAIPVKAAAAVPEPKKAAPEPVKLASAAKPPVKKVAVPAPAPKKTSLFDGGLSKEISEAAKAEAKQSNRGGAAAR